MIIGCFTYCATGILRFAFLKSIEMGADNSVVHYAIGIFLIYGVGYPVGHTAVIGLFSKGESLIFKVLLSLISVDFTTHVTHTCILYSCWEKTAGNFTGLVCFRWFIG